MRLVLLLSLLALASAYDYKHLAGEPKEFSRHRIPNPADAAITLRSVQLPLSLAGPVIQTTFAVDSASKIIVAFYSPLETKYDLSFRLPDGSAAPKVQKEALKFPLSDSGGVGAAGEGWTFVNPAIGNWTAVFTRRSDFETEPVHDILPNSFLIVWNDAEEQIVSHLSTYELEKDQQVGVISKISLGASQTVPTSVIVTKAVLDVIFPDQQTRMLVSMYDDGLHNDLAPNDGVYGGHFNATQHGLYKASAMLFGELGRGRPFARSSTHLMEVINDDVALAKTPAELKVEEGHEQLKLRLAVTGAAPVGTVYRAYAEVYAHIVGQKPVAWVGGYTEKKCEKKKKEEVCYVEVELNAHWLKKAGVDVRKGLILKNVYLSDHDSSIPLTDQPALQVKIGAAVYLHQYVTMLPKVTTPTETMLKGVRPLHLTPNKVAERLAALKEEKGEVPDLMLVHGYCAQIQPWKGGNFTNFRLFEDFDKSRPTAKFAELIVDQAKDMPRFGAIGHSQGGLANVHMHNYFWTGLESSEGPRKLQSVGTPYQGTAGAGSGADFIKVFGIGCGANFDLSPDGVALWSAGIAKSTRSDVYYFLTTWKDKGLVKYCNLATNLVLKWPNDGACEVERGPLEGAHDMGLTRGECHTLDMKYPPQYYDQTRNVEMNAQAAR